MWLSEYITKMDRFLESEMDNLGGYTECVGCFVFFVFIVIDCIYCQWLDFCGTKNEYKGLHTPVSTNDVDSDDKNARVMTMAKMTMAMMTME